MAFSCAQINGWFYRSLILIAIILWCTTASAAVELRGFRLVEQENLTLHFDLTSRNAIVNVFSLTKPNRVVVDMMKTRLATSLPAETYPEGPIKSVRHSEHGDQYLRVVIDLRQKANPSYRLVPRQSGARLVVDMGIRSTLKASSVPAGEPLAARSFRDSIVAIDAGHGGRDPGAIGPAQTYEKVITLSIAQKLHDRLNTIEGITAVMIRDSDVYIGLRERIRLAREARADLFISIHADAIERRQVQGSSVYALSLDGASSEAAALLAQRENATSALYGDLSLDDMNDGLAQTLLNLAQGNTMQLSLEAGAAVLAELGTVGTLHKPAVEQAAFAVLKSPDIPSILVETAFISNPDEERKLNDKRYQRRIVEAIGNGVVQYLDKRAPEGTVHWAKRQRGS